MKPTNTNKQEVFWDVQNTSPNHSCFRSRRSQKGGRPRKKVKRVCKLTISCSHLEKRIIRYKAAKSNMEISPYLRSLGLNRYIKMKKANPAKVKELRKLTGMGNNINQIARHLNSNKNLQENMTKSLEDLTELIALIKKDWSDWEMYNG
jgi:predicted RNase H-like nuclease (RuvC/YqgF family)